MNPHFSHTQGGARQGVAAWPERKVARASARKRLAIGLKPGLLFALAPFAPAGCEKCRMNPQRISARASGEIAAGLLELLVLIVVLVAVVA